VFAGPDHGGTSRIHEEHGVFLLIVLRADITDVEADLQVRLQNYVATGRARGESRLPALSATEYAPRIRSTSAFICRIQSNSPFAESVLRDLRVGRDVERVALP
jgi:hypothetical protein